MLTRRSLFGGLVRAAALAVAAHYSPSSTAALFDRRKGGAMRERVEMTLVAYAKCTNPEIRGIVALLSRENELLDDLVMVRGPEDDERLRSMTIVTPCPSIFPKGTYRGLARETEAARILYGGGPKVL